MSKKSATLLAVKDLTGNLLAMGDAIAYPVRKGSSMWMETATIDSIGLDNDKQGRPVLRATVTKDNGRKAFVTNFGRCVKIGG